MQTRGGMKSQGCEGGITEKRSCMSFGVEVLGIEDGETEGNFGPSVN